MRLPGFDLFEGGFHVDDQAFAHPFVPDRALVRRGECVVFLGDLAPVALLETSFC
ncbi:hypothetical protein [Paenarthrobacter aromaticivorans]|uniref:Uncharacterized protein n=1 Tax=Paenarthrobacter aromaticivorans TaxID=2849150 RepID=A0ABS6IAS8_9MICC|nr:hypothetical protein [Paenarthrobacter sp. MMS21-TAE1-1]MBU8868525.1 hypothetical protein [Paenarthrobacter sp. MMS21-TAE1-1]